MDNIFNQFDAAPATPPPVPNTNYGQNIFDQFHPPPAPQGYGGPMPPSPYELEHQSAPFMQQMGQSLSNFGNRTAQLATQSGQDVVKGLSDLVTPSQDYNPVGPLSQIASGTGNWALSPIRAALQPLAEPIINSFGNAQAKQNPAQSAQRLADDVTQLGAMGAPLVKPALEAMRPAIEALKPTPKPPSGLEPDLQNTLLNGSPDVRTYQGEQLGNQISEGAQAAKEAKNAAYAAAEEPSKALKISNNVTADLTDALTKSTEGFNPRVVNNVNGIQDTIDALNKDTKTGQASWARIDQVRQELYNLPKANDAEAKVRGNALRAYNDFADNVMQKGIIEGDDNAIKLVRDAHDKNAYWRQKFTGNDANNVIRDYIDKQGGLEQIAPENLLDKFTRVGQAGLDNVKAAKDVLGNSAEPILKHGYLNNIRTASVDVNGNINAKKFATQIDTLLTKNPTLVNEVFNESELNALRGAQRESLAYANGQKGQPGILTKLVSKAPVIGPLIEDVMKSRAQTSMVNDLSKVTKGKK